MKSSIRALCLIANVFQASLYIQDLTSPCDQAKTYVIYSLNRKAALIPRVLIYLQMIERTIILCVASPVSVANPVSHSYGDSRVMLDLGLFIEVDCLEKLQYEWQGLVRW